MEPIEPIPDETPAPLSVLLENHRLFLGYLTGRVGDRELAEDILQDAFTKVMERPELAPIDEGVVPWFYRMLRNATIDNFRRRGAASRAADAFSRELETHFTPEPEVEAEICKCVSRLAGTLKAEYAQALDAIDIRGTAVKPSLNSTASQPATLACECFGHAKPSRSASPKRAAHALTTAAGTVTAARVASIQGARYPMRFSMPSISLISFS